MSLLNKFASVEIKADNRISEEDKAFCLRHQDAFDKSGPALQKIANVISDTRYEQRQILGNDSYGTYILRLTSGWCYCDDQWSWGPEWKPNENLHTLLDALAWYQCGRMGEAALWFPELCKYTTKVNEFDTCNMSKVKFIKLFKNGRVDIKFRSAAYVQEFVEQCMRRRSV